MELLIIAGVVGFLAFVITFYMARNKRTRFLLAGSTGIWVGLAVSVLSTEISSIEPTAFITTPLGFTFLISVVLSFTLFINDRFNSPLIHYAALFALLFFSVLITSIIFPGDGYEPLREGIAVEILAGGVSTFLIFITIDAFNDQDADDRHDEMKLVIRELQQQIARLEVAIEQKNESGIKKVG